MTYLKKIHGGDHRVARIIVDGEHRGTAWHNDIDGLRITMPGDELARLDGLAASKYGTIEVDGSLRDVTLGDVVLCLVTDFSDEPKAKSWDTLAVILSGLVLVSMLALSLILSILSF